MDGYIPSLDSKAKLIEKCEAKNVKLLSAVRKKAGPKRMRKRKLNLTILRPREKPPRASIARFIERTLPMTPKIAKASARNPTMDLLTRKILRAFLPLPFARRSTFLPNPAPKRKSWISLVQPLLKKGKTQQEE